MRVRRSNTLALVPEGGGYSVFNYTLGSQFECTLDVLSALEGLDEWTPWCDVVQVASAVFPDEADAVLHDLLDLGVLVRENSAEDELETRFQQTWKWGPPSAIMHQAVTDRPVCDVADQIVFQQQKVLREQSPPLCYEPTDDEARIMLPDPETSHGLYTVLDRRRTVRDAPPVPVPLGPLSDMMFAGLGITGWTSNAVQTLPLKYAPSGGARNPYDGYLIAHEVEGLKPGVYRYSALHHCLSPIEGAEPPDLVDALAGQEWAVSASALIVLVANFPRTMWKYEGDDNAYRVVMIEAGHIAQNMMLMAGTHGLSACPSAALDHEIIARAAGLTQFEQSPIYAMAITTPGNATD